MDKEDMIDFMSEILFHKHSSACSMRGIRPGAVENVEMKHI
jgi:hypothetical protein